MLNTKGKKLLESFSAFIYAKRTLFSNNIVYYECKRKKSAEKEKIQWNDAGSGW